MEFDQGQLILHFCMMVLAQMVLAGVALMLKRKFAKPKGAWVPGMPDRRKRPRIVLPDPATLRPRYVGPGATI
jgi:hypothetical protein